MLVFSRKRGEAIVVGDGIEIVFLSSGREGVRIGVKAPLSVPVHRKEIYEQICEENRRAADALRTAAIPALAPGNGAALQSSSNGRPTAGGGR